MNKKVMVIDNKGFTLTELLCTVVIIGIITVIVINNINPTMSINESKAYEILKSNVISITKTYINECDNRLINCENDYIWTDNKTSFLASKLIKHNYFKTGELVNPINNNDISSCLIINVVKDRNSVLNITIDDNNC